MSTVREDDGLVFRLSITGRGYCCHCCWWLSIKYRSCFFWLLSVIHWVSSVYYPIVSTSPPSGCQLPLIVKYWIRERCYCWVLNPFRLLLLDLTGWCLKLVDYWWKGRRRAGVEYAVTNNAAAVREDGGRAFRLSIAAREDVRGLGCWVAMGWKFASCNHDRSRCCWEGKIRPMVLEGEIRPLLSWICWVCRNGKWCCCC